jgi:hypothetical protein
MSKKPTDIQLLQEAKDEQAKIVSKLQKKLDEKAAADAKVKAADLAKRKKANEAYRAKRLNKHYAVKQMVDIVTQAAKDMLRDVGSDAEDALFDAVVKYQLSKQPKKAVVKEEFKESADGTSKK